MRKPWILAAAGALALAALVFGIRRPFPAQDAKAPDVPSCPANAKRANLNFTLKDVDGRAVRLADYKGKVLLLDFWATWCGPCKVEIPGFVDLYRQYKPRGLEVVGVVMLDSFALAKPFARQFNMNYPVLDGVDREDIEEAFGPMFGLPTSFIIGRDGRICSKHEGLPPMKPSNEPLEKVVRDIFEAEITSLL